MPKKAVYEGLRVVEVASLEEFFKSGQLALRFLSKDHFFQNENLVLKAGKASALAVVKGEFAIRISERTVSKIKPKNKEQIFAINLLTDPKVQAVTLTGVAGTGKSLIAIASALDQCLGAHANYRKIIYVKSTIPVGEDIGFLPGGVEEKIGPYIGALYDCLAAIGLDKDTDEMVGYSEKHKVQIVASQFVRGRTFRDSFIIVDEAQNFTLTELKTILTRLDDSSKIVLLGDIDQVDAKLKKEEEGLYRVVEAFKEDELFGHINLIKSERGKLAQLVADRL